MNKSTKLKHNVQILHLKRVLRTFLEYINTFVLEREQMNQHRNLSTTIIMPFL